MGKRRERRGHGKPYWRQREARERKKKNAGKGPLIVDRKDWI